MDYLLQKSCTQAPHRESTETGGETPLGPGPCFYCILSILPTFPQTEQESSKMFCISASKAALGALSDLGCPSWPPEPGWPGWLISISSVSVLRENLRFWGVNMAASRSGLARSHSGPRLEAGGLQRPQLCTSSPSGPAWPRAGFPPLSSALCLCPRHWGFSTECLPVKTLCSSPQSWGCLWGFTFWRVSEAGVFFSLWSSLFSPLYPSRAIPAFLLQERVLREMISLASAHSSWKDMDLCQAFTLWVRGGRDMKSTASLVQA